MLAGFRADIWKKNRQQFICCAGFIQCSRIETSKTVGNLNEFIANETEINHFIERSFCVEAIMVLGVL